MIKRIGETKLLKQGLEFLAEAPVLTVTTEQETNMALPAETSMSASIPETLTRDGVLWFCPILFVWLGGDKCVSGSSAWVTRGQELKTPPFKPAPRLLVPLVSGSLETLLSFTDVLILQHMKPMKRNIHIIRIAIISS